MASAESMEDDRDTSLPASALSPAEYRSFRAFLLELHHRAGRVGEYAPLHAVLDFLISFNGVSRPVAQQIVDCVLGMEGNGDFVVADGHVYAMIRLIGHWQSEGRIERSMIFVQSRVPDRISSKATAAPLRQSTTPMTSTAPTMPTLNPFRASSSAASSSSSSSMPRTPATDKGVEAFKRLIFSNNTHAEMNSTTTNSTEAPTLRTMPPARTDGSLAPALEESLSIRSGRTVDQSATGMTFVYSSDEPDDDDDLPPSIKHSPETHQLRDSPSPIVPGDRRSLPPLQTQLSPHKPAPPPSRKRGASGSNQTNATSTTFEDKSKPEEKNPVKRNLPPLPPVPRRTLSSASTSHHVNTLDRSTSLRRDPPSTSTPPAEKPPVPRPRRKLSDTSVTSVDPPPAPPSRTSFENPVVPDHVVVPAGSKRLSSQAPPPPPPPRGGRKMTMESSARRSVEIQGTKRNSMERPESPRRSTAAEGERAGAGPAYEDSELSLELGKLQREVDQLVYGLTKKRGGVASLGGGGSGSSK